MKTICRPCFSLITPSVSSTYTNGGGVSSKFVEIAQKQSCISRRYTFGNNGGV